MLADKGVAFKVIDDPSIDTTSRTGGLIMRILALIAEFKNDIRRERQMDGIAKAKERGVHFGRKRELTPNRIAQIKGAQTLKGQTVPAIIRDVGLSKASVYRALRIADLKWDDLALENAEFLAILNFATMTPGRLLRRHTDQTSGRQR